MSKNDRSMNYEWPSTYSGSCNNWNNREMYSLQNLYWETTFSDYCCLFTLKLTVDFFLFQLPTFGLNTLFSIASFGVPFTGLGKGDWNFPVWNVDRKGGSDSFHVWIKSTFDMNMSVSLSAAERLHQSTDSMCAYMIASGNIVWITDLSLAMWENPIQ